MRIFSGEGAQGPANRKTSLIQPKPVIVEATEKEGLAHFAPFSRESEELEKTVDCLKDLFESFPSGSRVLDLRSKVGLNSIDGLGPRWYIYNRTF